MTWAEFQLRAFAYKRMEEKTDIRVREIAWTSLVAPYQDPKKMPKTKDKFWQIGTKKHSDMDVRMKEAIENAQREYLEAKKQKELDGIR